MGGWRRMGLAVSALVNLFLVAVIAGHLIGIGAYRDEGALIARALSNAQHSLSASDAAAFRAVMVREAPRFAASARALGASREVLAARITAPVFDRAAAAAAFGRWRGEWMRFTGDFSGPLLDALGTLSPDGRRRLLEERRRAGSDTREMPSGR